MKKIICVVILFVMSLMTLSGCANFMEFPNSYVTANDSMWRKTEIRIQIDDNYIINRDHPYDLIYVENGIDVTFHFVPRES